MDFSGLLLRPPICALEESVQDFLKEALAEEGAASTPGDLAELIGPFLLDAGLAESDSEVEALCRAFFADAGADASAAEQAQTQSSSGGALTVPAGPLGTLGALSHEEFAHAWDAASGVENATRVPATASKPAGAAAKTSRSAARAEAARATAMVEAALGDAESTFRLRVPLAQEMLNSALRAEWTALELESSENVMQADYLAAAFVTSAEELREGRLQQWCACLGSVLEEGGGVRLEEREERGKAIERLVRALVRKHLLEVAEKLPEVGDIMQACLPEDEEWHPVLIERVLEDSSVDVIFFEYGRPLTVKASDLCPLKNVSDDDDGQGLKEGTCEMCERQMPLTFHHLIPKDTHPTYLKKRLPRGIEGEPTRGFLNSYGLMICRKCHNMVHLLASNSTLAIEYNTLQKLMAEPMIYRWVEHAKKQRV
mmetsp:Transcript_136269/g.240285  ORF Transcript_136269/g.240285 Transcript_136269/m.240285 type:complete len:428 (+) Transcript_136269:37-1320(+)